MINPSGKRPILSSFFPTSPVEALRIAIVKITNRDRSNVSIRNLWTAATARRCPVSLLVRASPLYFCITDTACSATSFYFVESVLPAETYQFSFDLVNKRHFLFGCVNAKSIFFLTTRLGPLINGKMIGARATNLKPLVYK